MFLKDLAGACAYFPLGDYHNIRLFQNQRHSQAKVISPQDLKTEISNRLLMALLLFDTAIIHCSDPLRSQIICELLEENVQFIEEGSISILFSNHIEDVKSDYRPYIDSKIEKYSRSAFCATDVHSLTQDHMTNEYYQRVISLLDRAPHLVKKGVDGDDGFKDLIADDLSAQAEPIVLASPSYNSSYIRFNHLSLYQLMTIQYITRTGKLKNVFPIDEIDNFIENLRDNLGVDEPFSRHIITEQLSARFPDEKVPHATLKAQIVTAIESRLSRLYSMLNSDQHFILEFSPHFERRSTYSWTHFEKFLTTVSDTKEVHLAAGIVQEARNSEEWALFKTSFLSSMAELYAQTSSAKRGNLKSDGEARASLYSEILNKHNFKDSMPKMSTILNKGRENVPN